MGGAGYDPQRGFYLDAGGTNWGAFQALFRDFGKVLPGGSCYSVGLGGHICGGGYGLLSRLFGLTVDWLTGVEIVVKDDPNAPARVVYVSAASGGAEADLHWALSGGGGGNFGVITRYFFAELPDAPCEAAIVTLSFPWSELTAANLGDLLALYAEAAASPDNPQLFGLFKLNHQAATEIQLIVQVAATGGDALPGGARRPADAAAPPAGRGAAAPSGHPAAGRPSRLPGAAQGDGRPAALHVLRSGADLERLRLQPARQIQIRLHEKTFPQDQVETIYEQLQIVPAGLTSADMQQSLVQVDTYGGAINRVSPTATAIPQRSSILKLQYQTYWQKEEDDAAFLGRIRDFYGVVYAATGGVPDPARDPRATSTAATTTTPTSTSTPTAAATARSGSISSTISGPIRATWSRSNAAGTRPTSSAARSRSPPPGRLRSRGCNIDDLLGRNSISISIVLNSSIGRARTASR